MSLYFYITIIVGFSLLYYGYVKKIDTNLKIKKLELEEKKIDLEVKKLELNNENHENNKQY